ncbi:MAG TPA: phosphate ABC transporter substrate-binding protein PstS [Streptosporangiaceae bacterium]|nr:phosphate ABC transporter substrate-binding protein PstS [Streptosporangiaceae bacterium]
MAFRNRSLLAVSAALASAALVAACASSSGQGNGASSPIVSLSGPGPGTVPKSPASGTATITETGSSLLFPAFSLWASGYQSTYHNVTVKVTSTSSGVGIKDASEGNVDIGASDAFLSTGNLVQHPDLLNIPLAISAQQVNYNLPTVPLSKHLKLDGELLAKIYSGVITRWNDPKIKGLNPGIALPNIAIVPLHRAESSGDTFLFTSYLSAKASPANVAWGRNIGYGTSVAWPAHVGAAPSQQGNSGIEADCAATVGCVAYIGISYLHKATTDGLGYAALANFSRRFYLPTDAASIAAAVEPFVAAVPANEAISLVNGPSPKGYPIVNCEYAIVPDHYASPTTARDVKAFLHWVITTGSAPRYLGGDIMFQPLPAEMAYLADVQIARIK